MMMRPWSMILCLALASASRGAVVEDMNVGHEYVAAWTNMVFFPPSRTPSACSPWVLGCPCEERLHILEKVKIVKNRVCAVLELGS